MSSWGFTVCVSPWLTCVGWGTTGSMCVSGVPFLWIICWCDAQREQTTQRGVVWLLRKYKKKNSAVPQEDLPLSCLPPSSSSSPGLVLITEVSFVLHRRYGTFSSQQGCGGQGLPRNCSVGRPPSGPRALGKLPLVALNSLISFHI